MKFNVKLFGYLFLSVTVVQASRLIQPRNGTSLNSTNLADSITTNETQNTEGHNVESGAPQVLNSTQEARIINGNCDAQTKLIANQAIDDAIAMVRTVRDVWQKEQYRPVLEKYMGIDCLNSTSVAWINSRLSPNEVEWTRWPIPRSETLNNIANMKINWRWIINALLAKLLTDWFCLLRLKRRVDPLRRILTQLRHQFANMVTLLQGRCYLWPKSPWNKGIEQ